MPETAQQILDEFHAFRDTDLRDFRKSLDEMKDSLEGRIETLERLLKTSHLAPENPRQVIIDTEMDTILAWRAQFERAYKIIRPCYTRLVTWARTCKSWWQSHYRKLTRLPILNKR